MKQPGGIKLVVIGPETSDYTKGLIHGLRLGLFVGLCFEDYTKEMSRLIAEVTGDRGPGKSQGRLSN